MLGNVKIVLIIICSEIGAALLGRSTLNAFNIFGYALTILAGALYTAINLRERGQLRGAATELAAAIRETCSGGRRLLARLLGRLRARGGGGSFGGLQASKAPMGGSSRYAPIGTQLGGWWG